ncbi:MAG: DUF2892 domain-containing protein [Calditrichaeota bacterium]|nr:DUF2892 domain-containing protein [Calditrichota bacterium]
MLKNMGKLDRIIRLVIGIILISLIFWGPQTYWGLLGVILIITSFIGFCPAYWPFKISTRKNKEQNV